MARVIVFFLAILAIFSAVLMHNIHNRIYGLPIPDGFNPNSTFPFRMVGFVMNLSDDLCKICFKWSIIDDEFICKRNVYGLIAKVSTFGAILTDQIQVNDTEIFGTRVRIYKPIITTREQGNKLLPGLIYYHGGGWTVGSIDSYDPFCRRLAVEAQMIVISTDYRQAPEHLYPAAFHDSYNVAVGLLNNGTQYGVDVKRVLLAGDSAGGNLAAAVSHYLADIGEKHCRQRYIAGQILINPCLQFLSVSLPSHFQNEESLVLTRRQAAEYLSLYLTGNINMVDSILEGNHSKHLENTTFMLYLKEQKPEMTEGISFQSISRPSVNLSETAADALTSFKGSPLVAENFRGIPPTLIITSEFDPVRDDGYLYANRLRKAGIEVLHKNYHTFHAFVTITSKPSPFWTQEAAESIENIFSFIKSKVEIKEVEKTDDVEEVIDS